MPRKLPLLLLALPLLACQQSTPPGADSAITFYTHGGAVALYHAAKYDAAQEMCNQAIANLEHTAGPKSPLIAEPLIDLATIQLRLARYADAKQSLDRAESLLNRDIPDQAILLARLAIGKSWRLDALNEPAAARAVLEDAQKLLLKFHPAESLDLAEIINNLGLTYQETANENLTALGDAKKFLMQAWQMRRRLTADESPETAESLNNLAMCFLDTADLEANQRAMESDVNEALRTMETAVQVSIKVYGESHPEVAQTRANLAMIYIRAGDLDRAEKLLDLALPITTRFFGDKHPERSGELLTLGLIYRLQTHYNQAERAIVEAITINQSVYGPNSKEVITGLNALKQVYKDSGNEGKLRETNARIEKLSGKEI